MDWTNLSDIQVNSVLGQLRVIGDVGRDVLLTLSDPGASPVSIQVDGGDDGDDGDGDADNDDDNGDDYDDSDDLPTSQASGGSASLVLTKPLDKEGVLGQAQLIDNFCIYDR